MGDVSKHFSKHEYSCKCGCGLDNIAPEQFAISEIVRAHEGGKVYSLNSACRCHEHNESVQLNANPDYIVGTSKSKHMPDKNGACTAVDYPSKAPKALYRLLNSLFPDCYGIGLYNWGVHVDIRKTRARW